MKKLTTFFEKDRILLGISFWNGLDESGNDAGTILDIGLLFVTISILIK